ncbi:UPF0057-domain-containing protein [Cryphonectria parasitica EP155]|uniref:UPF0057-domain-containing protein n=1 Tax=Cryphonectria parasitica (strain ATCC 38755 / EP155) TaxID=660469 RepID=A0A9P4XW55_CRYP1|nr:UPF0057-domain-containing protein [Cryphonectria parasitica EP155]KAF3761875.1 UPF0057-domain-containing protein [Cryphonectria parasitica EP155]
MANGQVSSTSDMIDYFIAFFLPPVGVFLKRGLHADLWINILLTILGWIPGVLHAWWVIG